MRVVLESRHAREVVRALVPANGQWILERRIVEDAEAQGITARAARAAIAFLACGEVEAAKHVGGQLWIRWRAKE